MWYHYQIYNRLSNEVKAESYEQFGTPKEAIDNGTLALALMSLNIAIYKCRVIPVKENFHVRLKNNIIRFSAKRAQALITDIINYIDCGGKLDSVEIILLNSLKVRLARFHENFIYEISTR